MPHPFDTNYYANTGAFGPDGLLYVAQAAGGTDDSFGILLYCSILLSHTHLQTSLPCPISVAQHTCLRLNKSVHVLQAPSLSLTPPLPLLASM